MSRIGDSFTYHIDSDLRLSGTNTDFDYEIPEPTEYDYVALVQANIPKSYYLIQSGYNYMTLTEEGKTVTITVSPGSYNVKNFRTTMLSLLSSQSPNARTYTMQISTITGKYTFGTTAASASFTFPNHTGINKQMGFDKDTTNSFVAGIVTSVNIVQFQLSSAIYIKSDIMISKQVQSVSDGVLQEIFDGTATSDYDYIKFQNYNTELTAKRIKALSRVYHFTITDTDNRILPLDNGKSVVMSLVFYRSNDDYYKAQLGSLQLQMLDRIKN